MEIIIGRRGNQPVPITDATVSKQHCKVSPNGDGTFTLANISSNGTKVDGMDVIRSGHVKADSVIQLGPYFKSTLRELLAQDRKPSSPPSGSTPPPPQQQEKSVSIVHLKRIWDDYEQTNLDIANKQRSINLTRTGLGIFTMCVMPTLFFMGPVAYVLTGVGVLGNIYSFVGIKNAETPKEKTERRKDFERRYVCPNCKKNFSDRDYEYISRNIDKCPHCKVRFIK